MNRKIVAGVLVLSAAVGFTLGNLYISKYFEPVSTDSDQICDALLRGAEIESIVSDIASREFIVGARDYAKAEVAEAILVYCNEYNNELVEYLWIGEPWLDGLESRSSRWLQVSYSG